MKTAIIAWVGAGMAIACGDGGSGGSGLDGGKRYADLDTAETDQLCDYLFATFPTKMIKCSDSLTLTVGFKSHMDCVEQKPADATCTATVDDAEACAEAQAALKDSDWCGSELPLPAACAPLLTTACNNG